MRLLSDLTRLHIERIKAFYEEAPTAPTPAAVGYRQLLAHYYNLLIPPEASVLEVGCGAGELLALLNGTRKVGVDISASQLAAARVRVPDAEFHLQAGETLELKETFDYIVISDTLNLAADVQLVLARLHGVAHEGTRLIINYYSSLWRPILSLGRLLGIKSPQPQSSWISTRDMRNLLQLAD